MPTLAVSGLFLVVAEKWRTVTYGKDGVTFIAPEILKDRIILSCFSLLCLIVVYLLLKKLVNSPFGKVLVSGKDNESRTKIPGF